VCRGVNTCMCWVGRAVAVAARAAGERGSARWTVSSNDWLLGR
jgi:hypothetical protein